MFGDLVLTFVAFFLCSVVSRHGPGGIEESNNDPEWTAEDELDYIDFEQKRLEERKRQILEFLTNQAKTPPPQPEVTEFNPPF